MDIDLKDFIEGNDDLFTLCNYKEAESVLNKFLEWHKAHTLLATVPTSLKWKLKVAFSSILWFLSTSETKKNWNEFYYGLISHDHEYDYTKLEGDKYKHHPCKHYGCNVVSVQDKDGNWL
jgi:hypothetical protein